MTKIDFQVSIAGQDTVIETVTYTPKEVPPEVAVSPTRKMRWELDEAVDNLRQQIGHTDFEIVYWWWL